MTLNGLGQKYEKCKNNYHTGLKMPNINNFMSHIPMKTSNKSVASARTSVKDYLQPETA